MAITSYKGERKRAAVVLKNDDKIVMKPVVFNHMLLPYMIACWALAVGMLVGDGDVFGLVLISLMMPLVSVLMNLVYGKYWLVLDDYGLNCGFKPSNLLAAARLLDGDDALVAWDEVDHVEYMYNLVYRHSGTIVFVFRDKYGHEGGIPLLPTASNYKKALAYAAKKLPQYKFCIQCQKILTKYGFSHDGDLDGLDENTRDGFEAKRKVSAANTRRALVMALVVIGAFWFGRTLSADTKAKRERSSDFTASNKRGNAHFDAGDYDGAIAEYNRIIESDPGAGYAYYNRGNAYFQKGDYDRAIADYARADGMSGVHAITRYIYRGHAHVAKVDYDSAIADYGRAIDMNEAFVVGYLFRGIAYHQKGDYEQAVADYEMALKIDPDNAIAKTHLEKARQGEGISAEAF